MTTTHLLCGGKEVHTIDYGSDNIPIGSKVKWVAFTRFDAHDGSDIFEEVKPLVGEYMGSATIQYPSPHGRYVFNYGVQLIIID